jgi:predicted ATPase
MIIIVTGRKIPDNISEISEEATKRRGLSCHKMLMCPEAYCHPRDTANKMAKLVAERQEHGLNDEAIIIFTYSEAIVNSIGLMIYCKNLKDHTLVEIDIHHEDGEIQTATYDEEGVLDNWPFGFFDYNDEEVFRVFSEDK